MFCKCRDLKYFADKTYIASIGFALPLWELSNSDLGTKEFCSFFFLTCNYWEKKKLLREMQFYFLAFLQKHLLRFKSAAWRKNPAHPSRQLGVLYNKLLLVQPTANVYDENDNWTSSVREWWYPYTLTGCILIQANHVHTEQSHERYA